MEVLRLSKFKLQLRALIAETRHLRERERSASEQIHLLTQKQKQTEEEISQKLQELQLELSSSHDSRLKLETKVKYLESENLLLENKQKELKGTIHSLLQSRDAFITSYQDSTCEMKRSIQLRDRKIAVFSEKIQSHLLLLDSIEQESSSVKQVVDNVQQIVGEKEDLVAGLKRKIDQVSAFEKDLFGKIRILENKLRCNQDELRRKDKVISELQGQLEAAKISNGSQRQIEELQKALSMKEEVIQNLIAEKKALQFEAWSLEIIVGKIQDAALSMNSEDQKLFSSVLEDQVEDVTRNAKENDRSDETVLENKKGSLLEGTEHGAVENKGPPDCQERNSAKSPTNEKYNVDNCVSEQFVCTPQRTACSDPQSATPVQDFSIDEQQGKCTVFVQHQVDSERSTTEAEPSTDPAHIDGPQGAVISQSDVSKSIHMIDQCPSSS